MNTFSELEEVHSEFVEEAVPGDRNDAAMVTAGYTPYQLAYMPVDKSYNFYFELRGVRLNPSNNAAEYWVAFKPQSNSSLEQFEGAGKLDQTQTRFANWVALLQQYASVRLTKKERFLADSAEQFYQFFESAEEDATTAPFDNDQQVYMYKLLEFAKQKVEESKETNPEQAGSIIQEIKLLQESIPVVTKAAAVKKLSQVFARIKAFSMKLFVDSFDVAKKEIIKAALYGGMDQISQAVYHLT